MANSVLCVLKISGDILEWAHKAGGDFDLYTPVLLLQCVHLPSTESWLELQAGRSSPLCRKCLNSVERGATY